MNVITEQNVIEVIGLWRRYGPPGDAGFDAVRGVDLTVTRGRLLALLGTNGAGKTSLVELLEGLARPSSGSIRLFGDLDPIRDRARIRPRTGVMLQEGGFPGDLTVRETVRMWAACTTRARPCDEALEMVGLAGRGGVTVKHLSGGEKRRLDLALATLGRPELLFLDEPTTGMDPEGRHDVWRIIEDLRSGGTTIVLTTHYLEEAERLADQLAIMHAGQISVTGTVAEIVAAHPSTLGFRLPSALTPADLPGPAVLRAEARLAPGGRIELRTGELQHTTTEVLIWARDRRIEISELAASSASLNEAFLRIAGQSQSAKDPA
ncbi:ABC transporter ATP-binding protein [Streptomyces sp. SID1034]|uniref:ABC transporter ATP-binding protein n=1 Tax=Streptomyces sp. SID1034 TaxID=2690248 RepID=UPI001369FCF3|nr:ABC transporter ATP-binding protein [Streptomyces sp. SID1034]MYV89968.1 ATP-binding cassette domain-containing protein [Streptomyces sp. SID1034]